MASKSKKGVGKSPTPSTQQLALLNANVKILGDAELARLTGLSENDIAEYRAALPPLNQQLGRATQAMHRPLDANNFSKGVVAMTQEASEAADDLLHIGVATQADVNAALAAGDLARAEQLREQIRRGISDRHAIERAQNDGKWHFIR
jgi:hypothetical protein